MTMAISQEVFSPQEVADLTDVKVLTVYRWIKEGKLKATKLGRWRINRVDLQAALGMSPETFDKLREYKRKEGIQ